ncbi:MAG TPA: CPBP family intramembrane glutamic endopeptidase [Caulobacteraceae bacterium]|nr:CPBP family intramembrane glutamic endopeptidase [Caulobacteraceae bacterium]
MSVPAVLLVIALAGLAWSTRRSQRQYALFKAYAETRDRQRFYRRWLVGGLLEFGVGSLIALWVLGRLEGVRTEPATFLGLTRWLRAAAPAKGLLASGALSGLAIGIVAGSLVTTVIAARRAAARRTDGADAGGVMLGDIAPLLPRNARETLLTGLLSINAGVTEELFFRLLLPLLVTLVTGDARLGFVAAGVIFGLAHIYQGWVGVVATSVIGGALSAIYLWSGQLWVAMAVHAGFDLIGLVVRPTLARALSRRRAARNP